jgi:1-phosphatidylinositol-3-phosphate 5-kinase
MHCHLHHPLELLPCLRIVLLGTSVEVAEVSLIIAMVLLHFQVSPVVQISADTWSLSFAKYLELHFYGQMYRRRGQDGTVCPHSLHHEHYQYFGMRNVVASFRYV